MNDLSADAAQPLQTHERVELTLIPVLTSLAWIFHTHFPPTCSLGNLFLALAGIFLAQGLVRDLWIWTRLHFSPASERSPQVAKPCMCVESMVGVAGIAIGLLLLGAMGGNFLTVRLFSWAWPVLVFMVLSAGYLLKDLVFDWSSRRILRERDHSNWIPRWR